MIGSATGRIFPTMLVIELPMLVKDVVSAVSTEERPVLVPASAAKTGTAVATARAPPINTGQVSFQIHEFHSKNQPFLKLF